MADQKPKYLKHPDTGAIFPYSEAIAINPYLIPTDEKPEWAKEADTKPASIEEAPVKKGPFGRPVKPAAEPIEE